MSVSQLAHVVGRYWRSIAVILALVIALSATATALTPARYTASSSLFLGVRGAESASDLNQGGSYMERQVASYAKVATSSMVMTPVIARLGLAVPPGELARDVAVTSPANTAILEISASQPTPALAQALADAVAEELVVAVKRLAPTSGDEALVTATITDPAELPLTQSSPRVLQNLALGAVLALLLAFGQAVLRQRLDTRVRHVDDAVEATGLGVLAGIAREGAKQPSAYGYGTSHEDLRSLRTNLRFLGLGTTRNPHLVVTSSVAGEGKTHGRGGQRRHPRDDPAGAGGGRPDGDRGRSGGDPRPGRRPHGCRRPGPPATATDVLTVLSNRGEGVDVACPGGSADGRRRCTKGRQGGWAARLARQAGGRDVGDMFTNWAVRAPRRGPRTRSASTSSSCPPRTPAA